MRKVLLVLVGIVSVVIILGKFPKTMGDSEGGSSTEIIWLEEKPTPQLNPKAIPCQVPLMNVIQRNYSAYEYVYTTLNPREQMAYRKIISTIKGNSNGELIDIADYQVICCVDLSEYQLSEQEMVETYWSVLDDHEELYYVAGNYLGYIDENESLIYVMASDLYSNQPQVDNALTKYETDVINGTNCLQTQEEKVQFIFDYVLKHLSYAENRNGQSIVNDKTASIACVVDGKAICSGYAKLFAYLCRCVDIPAIYVTGYVDEGYHAWTYVQIENLWFACDTTFSDYGQEVYMKGQDIFRTHEPSTYGVNTDGFCYSLPALSILDYADIEEPESEEATIEETKGQDIQVEMKNEEQDQKYDPIAEIYCEKMNSFPEVPMLDAVEEMTNEVGTHEQCIDYDPFLDEPIYLVDGEHYIKGLPIVLYYFLQAQDSLCINTRIDYYMEALKYVQEREQFISGIYFNLGCCYSQLNDFENSFEYYLRAIEAGDMCALDNLLLLIENSEKTEEEKLAAYYSVLCVAPDEPRVLDKL